MKLFAQKTPFIGINKRNRDLIMKNNPKKWLNLADDKVQTKKWLTDYNFKFPFTYAIIDQIGTIHNTWFTIASQQESCVIKPAKGSKGGGIWVLRKKNNQWYKGKHVVTSNDISRHIANILFGMYSGNTSQDRAIIEEVITCHSTIFQLAPYGLADIRIISLRGDLLMGMLRLPTLQSEGKANLHQGGIGLGVNMTTGSTTHARQFEKIITKHPDSNQNLIGIKIPYWENILRLSKSISKSCPLAYLGQDIVIDQQRGPLILELNARPGLSIQVANNESLQIPETITR